MSTWPNVFMKVMRAQITQTPSIDWATLTREEILEQLFPCRSIEAAVRAGFLEKVPGFEALNHFL